MAEADYTGRDQRLKYLFNNGGGGGGTTCLYDATQIAEMDQKLDQIIESLEAVVEPLVITANGTYSEAGKAFSPVTVNVSGDPDLLLEMDFTKWTGTLHRVIYSSDGAHFNSNTASDDYIPIPYAQSNMTIELDIESLNCWSGYHRRIIMASPSMGFIYRNNGVWAFYSSNGWQNSSLTNGALFYDPCKLGVYIDSSNKWHIYKDGVLIFEPSTALPLISKDGTGAGSTEGDGACWFIGSPGGNSIPQAMIKSLKLFKGNKYAN